MQSGIIGASYGLQEIIWLQRLIRDILLDQKLSPTTFYLDTQSAFREAASVARTKCPKHMDIRHHHFAHAVCSKLIQVKHISSHYNTADIMTKTKAEDALHRLVHRQFTNLPFANAQRARVWRHFCQHLCSEYLAVLLRVDWNLTPPQWLNDLRQRLATLKWWKVLEMCIYYNAFIELHLT